MVKGKIWVWRSEHVITVALVASSYRTPLAIWPRGVGNNLKFVQFER